MHRVKIHRWLVSWQIHLSVVIANFSEKRHCINELSSSAAKKTSKKMTRKLEFKKPKSQTAMQRHVQDLIEERRVIQEPTRGILYHQDLQNVL